MRRHPFRHCAAMRLAIFVVPLWLYTCAVSASESAIHTEPDWETISSSALYFSDQHGLIDAPLLNTSVDVSITGLVARVTLTQRFRNDSTDWVEGLYAFPLPDKAAVNSLNIKIGEREIVGSVRFHLVLPISHPASSSPLSWVTYKRFGLTTIALICAFH